MKILKSLFVFFVFIVATEPSSFAKQDFDRDHDRDDRCNERTVICKLPFVISKPGRYILGRDLDFTTFTPGSAAITINASNVFLNMRNRTLSTESTTVGTIGILVNGQSNIIIQNGFIQGFLQNGIRVNNSSEILIKKIRASHNGFTDINLPPTSNYTGGGLLLLDTTDLAVKNSNFDANVGAGIQIGGITKGCSNITIDHVTCNNNTGVGAHNTFAVGLAIEAAEVTPFIMPNSDIRITNSEFNGNSGNQVVFGIFTDGDPSTLNKKIFIENCTASDNILLTGGDANPGNEAIGFGMRFIDGLVIRNCLSARNDASHGPTSKGEGFSFINVINGFAENLTSYDNIGVVESDGFVFNGSSSVVIRDSTAALTTGNASVCVGFNFRSNPGSKNVVEGCSAQNHQGAANSAGFFFSSNSNCLIEHNEAISNSVGILITAGSPNNIIQQNTLIENTLAGILDAPSNNNTYIANVARGLAPNYVGIPPATPIQTWIIGSPPGVSAFPNIENLDIHP